MTGFLLKLGDAKMDMEAQKSRIHQEESSEEPEERWVKESVFVRGSCGHPVFIWVYNDILCFRHRTTQFEFLLLEGLCLHLFWLA